MKTKTFINTNLTWLLNSFKNITFSVILIILLDILFYFLFVQFGKIYVDQLQVRAMGVDLNQGFASAESVKALLASLKGFLFYMIFSTLLLLFAIIILFSIIKGTIWLFTAKKKANIEFYKKFVLLNIIWYVVWIIIIATILIIFRERIAVILLMIALFLTFYFTNILYPLFLKNNRIKTIKTALKVGIKKIHYFIIPYVTIIASFTALTWIFNKIFIAIQIDPRPMLVFSIAFLLLYIAWMRYYFIEIVNEISQNQ